MSLPPLYKYLDVRGAKLTLGNGTFKHAKPSDFNDVEDLTVQSIFPDELEIALQKITSRFMDAFLEHLNDSPTCASPLKEQITLIQQTFRMDPEAARIVKAEFGSSVYDVEHMRKICTDFIAYINEFMQDYRILCVTTLIDSEQMWSGYAENHKGIALRIEPNLARNSKFALFRPVQYLESRPPFYDDPLDFIVGSMFGDQEARARAALDKIIYSKTLAWQYESEYRLSIPLRNNEPPWNTDPYHPEEVTELYIGLATAKHDEDEIVAMARSRNPGIAIFKAYRDANGVLKFDTN